jgi:hypothetical protein
MKTGQEYAPTLVFFSGTVKIGKSLNRVQNYEEK